MKTDNAFKDKLFQHTVPVRDGVWERIEEHLPPSREKRLPFFWLILFASAAFGSAVMFGAIDLTPSSKSNDMEQQPAPVDTSSEMDHSTSYHPDVSENSDATSPASGVSNSSAHSATPTTPSNTSTGTTATISSQSYLTKPESPTSSSGSASVKSDKRPSTGTPNYSEISSASASVSKGKRTTKNKASNVEDETSTALHNSAETKSQPQQTKNKLSQTSAEEAFVQSTSNTLASSTTSSASAQAIPSDHIAIKLRDRATTPHIDLRSLLLSSDSDTKEEDVLADVNAIRADPSCYRFTDGGKPYFFSFDIFSGPGFSPRSFRPKGVESSVYRQAREATERNQYAWSAGARINLHLPNGLGVKLGLMYDQTGDVFDYTDTLATRSTFQIDSFWAADGTFLYSDTSRVVIFGTLIKKIHNTFRHIDVPFLFSYEQPIGRSALFVNAGPVVNLSSSYEGQILDPLLHPRSITPGRQNVLPAYKTSLGLSLYIGAGLQIPLNDHFAALIEPRYLWRIKPVTLKSYPIDEYRHFAGLNVGLTYYFE